MKISSANLIAAMILTAFVIERTVAAAAFAVSLIRQKGTERKELLVTLLRMSAAGVIAAVVIYKFDWMRLLSTFDVTTHPRADMLLTWLVLVSGTDRLSSFIGHGADQAAAAKKEASALELHGTIAVDQASVEAVKDRAVA
jgi:hypothetical protein